MADNFFALLDGDELRKIQLQPGLDKDIGNIFSAKGQDLLVRKRVEFDGNQHLEDDETLFVTMKLPDCLKDIKSNSTGITVLDISKDKKIKTLIWYDDEKDEYYFQNFDSRKMLRHKYVIYQEADIFNSLKSDAFIVDNAVNAVFKDGQFCFTSYANANRIFSLAEFFKEATDDDIQALSNHTNIEIPDLPWFIENANTVLRKHSTILAKSGTLDGMNTTKVKTSAKKFKLEIELNAQGKITFPKDKSACRELLLFLNEQYYEGIITGAHYKAPSKRKVP